MKTKFSLFKKFTRSQWQLNHLCAEPPPKCQHSAPSLMAISLVKVEISIFEIVTWPHTADVIKGSCGFKEGAFHSNSAPYLIQCPCAFCEWRYDKFILCYVNSQDYFIEESCEFIGGSSSRHDTTLTTLTSLVTHEHCESRYMFLNCPVTWRDHMLYEWEILIVCHHLVGFGGHRFCWCRNMSLIHHVI